MKIEATTRLQISSGLISPKDKRKFLSELFKTAKLAKLGFFLQDGSYIRSQRSLEHDQLDAVVSALKKAGFSKPWKPKPIAGKKCIGLSTKEGTWPIIIEARYHKHLSSDKDAQRYDVDIVSYGYDSLEKTQNKNDDASIETFVQEIVGILKVKTKRPEVTPGRYQVGVRTPNHLNSGKAKSMLEPKYGKGNLRTSTSSKIILSFKTGAYSLSLVFFDYGLETLVCEAL